jgi:hypothetical protein
MRSRTISFVHNVRRLPSQEGIDIFHRFRVGGIGKSHQTNSGFSAQRTTRRFVRKGLIPRGSLSGEAIGGLD